MITITESNCNYHLTRLYKERDMISIGIDRAITSNRLDSIQKLEEEYNDICDTIDEFLAFRRTHDCLIEGDRGYGPI